MASSPFSRVCLSFSQESDPDPSQVSSHHTSNSTPTRPRNQNQTPTQNHKRKHERSSWPRHHFSHFLLVTILLSCFFSLTTASASTYIPIEEEMVEEVLVGETVGSTFARLARSGTIIVDPRSPPEPPQQNWDVESADPDMDLRRRNLNGTSSVKTTSATATASGGIVAATTSSVPSLPTPFDTGFNNNITTSCATFMNSMLSNATFKSCLPFSLLLQVHPTSNTHPSLPPTIPSNQNT